ncbi:hypothetical protein EEB14_63010, partial [Rhodococcus sp. WS4]
MLSLHGREPVANLNQATVHQIGNGPDLLRGPAAGLATKGVYWRGLLVTAIDGTMMCCPDTVANLQVY